MEAPAAPRIFLYVSDTHVELTPTSRIPHDAIAFSRLRHHYVDAGSDVDAWSKDAGPGEVQLTVLRHVRAGSGTGMPHQKLKTIAFVHFLETHCQRKIHFVAQLFNKETLHMFYPEFFGQMTPYFSIRKTPKSDKYSAKIFENWAGISTDHSYVQ